MPTEPLQLDGNLRDVLESIAKNPKAKLFRRNRALERAALRGDPIVRRPTEPGLVAAERELLRVHRSSIALFLRHAAWRQLADSNNKSKPSISFPLWDRDRLRREVEFIEHSARIGLSRSVVQGAQTLEGARQAACLALEFEYHLSPISCASIALVLLGQARVAISYLQAARVRLSDSPSEHQILDHLGYAESELGHDDQSLRHYLEAARQAPYNQEYWARAFVKGVMIGDSRTLQMCDSFLKDFQDPAAVKAAAQRVKEWSPTEIQRQDALSAARSLKDQVSSLSRSLLDAFFE